MLETALDAYPLRTPLNSGLQVLLRPMQPEDRSAFQAFLPLVPEIERLFIKEHLTDPKLLQHWCRDLDFESELPLLALADGQIVGLAALQQRLGGWKRHIARVRLLTHPDYRGLGLASLLIENLIELARHAGLARLEAEFNAERTIAIQAFASAGFKELVRLPGYVIDMHGGAHDLVMLGMDITLDAENTGLGD